MSKNNGFLEQELVDRLNQAERQVKKHDRPGGDLTIMYRVCENLRSELSKESIECRRLHKPTPKFLELYEKLLKQLENLEMNITFVALKNKHKEKL